MLHIVNKSPFERPALDACLRLAQAGSAILLIEDGVYAATGVPEIVERFARAPAGVKVFALSPDIEARGLQERIRPGVERVDHAGFVDLVTQYPAVQSWL
jgi:tRNA 2-thiouridine synthesizing protein B